jgi:hypothetical protein
MPAFFASASVAAWRDHRSWGAPVQTTRWRGVRQQGAAGSIAGIPRSAPTTDKATIACSATSSVSALAADAVAKTMDEAARTPFGARLAYFL